MAKGARQRGVEIVRKAQVDGYDWTGSEWIVRGRMMAEKGGNLVPSDETFEIRAEHVVTATGNHAQRTARLLGISIPAIPVEHQYIVTEPDPALVAFRKANREHPVLRDADARWYVREERGGWILGPYENGAPARFEHAVPDSFRADLFPLDLERIETEYLSMIHRIPSSESVGLKDDFNGPICYTPDGNPLVGPAPGLRNLWLAEGFSFGITAAGGTGHYLAQMMVEGEAEIDMASLDPKRYGAVDDHRVRRAQERGVLFPRLRAAPPRRGARGLPAAAHRPLLRPGEGARRPVRPGQRLGAPELLRAAGLRRPRRAQLPPRRLVALRRRGGEGDPRERRHDRRHRLHQARRQGPRRHRLPRLVHHQPAAEGRPPVSLTYALTDAGTIRTEYTILRMAEHDYYLVSAGAWAAYDDDFLRKAAEDRIADFGRIEIQDVTTQCGVFAARRPALARRCWPGCCATPTPPTALGNKRFPWLSAPARSSS